MDLSIVIPVYNEVENLRPLYDELCQVLDTLGRSSEIVFVDDGSRDGSLEVLTGLHQADKRVVVVSFRRNFGQTAAMAAGFDHAAGEIVVTMDADMQNDPRDIPALLAKIEQGFDVVTGWRFDRKDAFFSRRLPSVLANRLISKVTGVALHDYGCTLKAFRREVITGINLYGEMHRFIPAIASGMGIDIAEIKVNHRPRKFGASKYNITRTIRVLLDLFTVKFLLSYATRPLHVFGTFGLASGGLGAGITLWLVFQRQMYGMSMGNRPMLFFALLLLFMAMQFISLGLMAELQVRTYHESQNKPIYAVRKLLRRT